jgi:hypothetical protein
MRTQWCASLDDRAEIAAANFDFSSEQGYVFCVPLVCGGLLPRELD